MIASSARLLPLSPRGRATPLRTPQRGLGTPARPTEPEWHAVRIFSAPAGGKLPVIGFHGSPVAPGRIFGDGASGLRPAEPDPAVDLRDPQTLQMALRQHLEGPEEAYIAALRNDEPYCGRLLVSLSKAPEVACHFAIDRSAPGEAGYCYLIDLRALAAGGVDIVDVNRAYGAHYAGEHECSVTGVPRACIVGAIPVRREGGEFDAFGRLSKLDFIPNPHYTGGQTVLTDEL